MISCSWVIFLDGGGCHVSGKGLCSKCFLLTIRKIPSAGNLPRAGTTLFKEPSESTLPPRGGAICSEVGQTLPSGFLCSGDPALFLIVVSDMYAQWPDKVPVESVLWTPFLGFMENQPSTMCTYVSSFTF